MCTVPNCQEKWRDGYMVGCQWCPHKVGKWYSLPGPCPSSTYDAKTPQCIEAEPGGHCVDVTGAPDCTYRVEEAGQIFLNDLIGIQDYTKFCRHGGMEYVRE